MVGAWVSISSSLSEGGTHRLLDSAEDVVGVELHGELGHWRSPICDSLGNWGITAPNKPLGSFREEEYGSCIAPADSVALWWQDRFDKACLSDAEGAYLAR